MTEQVIQVLLVEDNPTDVLLLRETLAQANQTRFKLSHVELLAEALECLSQEFFDAILLDLSLPDSQGLVTLVKIREQAQRTPIVVLTGAVNDAQAIEAIQTGAQDYLVKGETEGNLLGRVLRYALERHRLQEERQRQEFDSLVRLSAPAHSTLTAELFGLAPLRQSLPEVFAQLVTRYGEI